MAATRFARCVSLLCLTPGLGLQCDSDFDTLKAGDTCTSTWAKLNNGPHRLRATEPSIGWAWAVRQMEDFIPKEKGAEWLATHDFPVAIGHSNLFLVDGHHHAYGLQLTGDEDLWDLEVTVTVKRDLRTAGADFWHQMTLHNDAFLYSIDDSKHDSFITPLHPAAMQTDFILTNSADNIWRSLAGFSGHVDDTDNRCFLKACSFFLEYAWAQVFTDATYHNSSLWPSSGHDVAFRTIVEALPLRPDPNDVDLDAWFNAAQVLLPLCHSPAVKGYQLPSFFPDTTVQGWSATPMPHDPNCPDSPGESRGESEQMVV